MQHYTTFDCEKIIPSDVLTFDIEVSSYWIDDKNNIVAYSPDISDEEYNAMQPCSICYIWQFGYNDTFYYGRELSEFYEFIQKLNNLITEESHIIWIHNLSYEFVFLANYLEYDSVFARNNRHPMKATWKKIEFRCTYFLTRLSLAKWGEQNGVEKLVEQMDYTILRTPKTKLTKNELEYAERDLYIMYVGLQVYIKRYGCQNKIPLTQTGEVRRVIKDKVKRDNRYHRLCTRLVPKSVNEYKMLRKVFAGGDVHGNMSLIGKILLNVGSFDETSGYPGMLFRKKYPMSPWYEVNPDFCSVDYTNYCYIRLVEFTNIKAKTVHHYISKSRMICVQGGQYDNGRVISADFIAAYLTEIDYELILKTYEVKKDDIKIVKMYKSRKAYIDTAIIETMLDFFEKKTCLAGIDNELYMFSKQQLNSMFGMCVTDPVNADIVWVENKWKEKPITNDTIQERLEYLRSRPYENFLSYSWGIYCTAYNREELWDMILAINENDVVYYDTDSVKFLNPKKYAHLFEERNKKIIAENKKACTFHGFPKDCFIKTKPSGKKSILGAWDNEGDSESFICYDKFVTLGAKKYAYEKNGEIGITVAGVPKKASVCLKSLEEFKEGFVFDREICGKNQLKYIPDKYVSENPLIVFNDGYKQKEKLGINIKSAGYTLGLDHDFSVLVNCLNEKGWNI